MGFCVSLNESWSWLFISSYSMRKGGFMKKILITLIVASLLAATTAAPVFARGWGGHSRGWGGGVDIFWPVAAALAIPAAIIGTVANLTIPPPVGYGYGAPPVAIEPEVYSGPATYYGPGAYAPRVYVAPRGYYAPRAYAVPRGYYSPRPYYPDRGYRTYGNGW
jgi:hypothetical protein